MREANAPFPVETREECFSGMNRIYDLRIAGMHKHCMLSPRQDRKMIGDGVGEMGFESSVKDRRAVARSVLEQVRDNIAGVILATSDLQDFSMLVVI